MALTLTQAELAAAIRLGDSTEEAAEATRLLAYATEAISRHLGGAFANAPAVIVNEAAIRLAGYLFDQPNAGRGLSFANAGRNSGAWAILLPFRVHRAGSTGEAVAAAQEAVGTPGNPVTNVAMTTHNTDTVARSTARNARQTAEQAQTGLEAHEASTHNHDAGARTAAANAQSAIEDHERTPHNTDTVARNAAAAAQTAAEAAAAGGGRIELYRDTADYSRTTASTIFRQFDLSRAPARGKGLELVIASSNRNWKAPFYCGTTDDWIDLTALTAAQLNGVISAAVPVANTIPVKSIALDESSSNSFGHGIVYVGRVNDTRMGVGIAQRRGIGERFRMTVREIP